MPSSLVFSPPLLELEGLRNESDLKLMENLKITSINCNETFMSHISEFFNYMEKTNTHILMLQEVGLISIGNNLTESHDVFLLHQIKERGLISFTLVETNTSHHQLTLASSVMIPFIK